jgi:hypothetical protein
MILNMSGNILNQIAGKVRKYKFYSYIFQRQSQCMVLYTQNSQLRHCLAFLYGLKADCYWKN